MHMTEVSPVPFLVHIHYLLAEWPHMCVAVRACACVQVHRPGSCPYRPAEKHVHNDAFSNYGAGAQAALGHAVRLLQLQQSAGLPAKCQCMDGSFVHV